MSNDNQQDKGWPQIDIASKLGISRQAVNQALLEATEKVAKALTEAALINKIEVESVNPIDGILSGWSREFSVKAVITLTRKDGIQVWYEHELTAPTATSSFPAKPIFSEARLSLESSSRRSKKVATIKACPDTFWFDQQ